MINLDEYRCNPVKCNIKLEKMSLKPRWLSINIFFSKKSVEEAYYIKYKALREKKKITASLRGEGGCT